MRKIMLFMVLLILLSTGVMAADPSAVASISLINQDPDPALAGDTVEVRLGIENIGGEALSDAIIEFIPSYPFTLLDEDSNIQYIGKLNPYQEYDNQKIVKFNIKVDKDATAGTYDLKFYFYEEGSTTILQKVLSIDVGSTDSAEIIYIDQVELIPGQVSPMTFTINNVGSAPLRELTFSWENEDDIILPVGSDNNRYIKYVDVGEQVDLTFDVMASTSADPDLYKLDLLLTYEDSLTNSINEITTKAGVYVGGATDFDVAYSSSSDGEYSFTVANIGSISASSVSIHIPNQDSWSVSGSDSVMIGNLNEGDYTIATFTLSASRSGPPTDMTSQQQTDDSSDLTIEVIYTDSRGNRETVSKTVTMDSSSASTTSFATTEDGEMTFPQRSPMMRGNQSSFWDQAKWIIIAVVLVVVIFVARRKYQRKKLEDPDYTMSKFLSFSSSKKKRR